MHELNPMRLEASRSDSYLLTNEIQCVMSVQHLNLASSNMNLTWQFQSALGSYALASPMLATMFYLISYRMRGVRPMGFEAPRSDSYLLTNPMFYECTTSELRIIKTLDLSTTMNLTWQERIGFTCAKLEAKSSSLRQSLEV